MGFKPNCFLYLYTTLILVLHFTCTTHLCLLYKALMYFLWLWNRIQFSSISNKHIWWAAFWFSLSHNIIRLLSSLETSFWCRFNHPAGLGVAQAMKARTFQLIFWIMMSIQNFKALCSWTRSIGAEAVGVVCLFS